MGVGRGSVERNCKSGGVSTEPRDASAASRGGENVGKRKETEGNRRAGSQIGRRLAAAGGRLRRSR
eukprot:scaffold1134_cov28-Tisochrysis_lutea.AAC.3